MKRRDFLKKAAVGTAALGATAALVGCGKQASLRPRERFWDIQVPKIDSAFDNLLVLRTSWS
ncbi:twin-arginine translocation signal domain-containing protein, partial [Solemya velesiana gill symbiont]